MNVVCIGGGPAGLYLGILLKLQDSRHRVVVYERNRPSDTFGFGVVFSHATLGNLAAADPESYAEITRHFARWDDIEIHVRGQVLRSTGHGFCGLERKQLLLILQERARALGVELHFEHTVSSLDDEVLRGADVIVAGDGVASWVRDAQAGELGPSVDIRPNKFVWLGTTVPYRAFTFLFKESPFGLFRIHAYPYSAERSTFIAECRHDTWLRAGFDTADEDRTVAVLEQLFAQELGEHRLIKNRSIWRNFPTVRCQRWHAGNLVIVGDAAHTAHFSIGSGTKLAMEDSIELAAALLSAEGGGAAAIPAALAAYQARRMPEVESLQAAAQASLEWFEGTERYMHLPPAQFAYNLMTRSLRVSHASMHKRDPDLARAVEPLLSGGQAGVAPRKTAVALGEHRLLGRAIAAGPADQAAGVGIGGVAGAAGAAGAAPLACWWRWGKRQGAGQPSPCSTPPGLAMIRRRCCGPPPSSPRRRGAT
ncbi:MAG: FAD-dependent monooxygenase [Myxococcales bacterium]|nr:FAD-dependent monooxygenase [Myxococcales bacterium]